MCMQSWTLEGYKKVATLQIFDKPFQKWNWVALMQLGLESEELAFQEKLAFAKLKLLEDKLLEHDDELILK